ncbi:MAG: Crp/Fnr family transcriptional regulator [Saccharofermentanales bacterium]
MIDLSAEQMQFIEHRIPFWSELNEAQKKMTLTNINFSKIAQGAQLVRSSSECSGMILLREGRIRAFISSEDGREITLYRLLPGDACVMTASCMLKNVRFQVYLEVEKNVSMFVIPQSIFIRLNTENSAVKDFTMNLMADRFSQVVSIVEQMVFVSIPNRIAIFLMEQSGLNDTDDLEITHDTIAKNIGTAREVVSRVLKTMENDGLVRLARGHIRLLDIRRLFDMTNL